MSSAIGKAQCAYSKGCTSLEALVPITLNRDGDRLYGADAIKSLSVIVCLFEPFQYLLSMPFPQWPHPISARIAPFPTLNFARRGWLR